MNEIEPGLYLGNIFAAHNVRALRSAGITHIISILKKDFDKGLPNGIPKNSIKRMLIEIDDHPDEDLISHFARTNEFIEEGLQAYHEAQILDANIPPKKLGGVLIHCVAGASRSPTVVAAYLMQKHRLSSSEAVLHLCSIRPIVCPNPGFLLQLEIYEAAKYDIVTHSAVYEEWVSKRGLRNREFVG